MIDPELYERVKLVAVCEEVIRPLLTLIACPETGTSP